MEETDPKYQSELGLAATNLPCWSNSDYYEDQAGQDAWEAETEIGILFNRNILAVISSHLEK